MQLVLEVPDKKVYQHTTLVNAKYDMSLYQMRIFLYLLSKINAYDHEFAEISIPVRVICDSVGGNSQQILDNITEDLTRWAFTFATKTTNHRGKVKEGKVTYPLLSMCSYTRGNSYVLAKFNPDFADYLLDLKVRGNFTESDYHELRELRNYCSHRLYWLLKEKYTYGYRDIPVDALRDMLNLNTKYPKFNDLKTKVLDPVKKELGGTAVAFEYHPIRQGRNVVALRFQLLKNVPSAATLKALPPVVAAQVKQAHFSFEEAPALTDDERKVFERMVKIKLSKKTAMQVLKTGATPKQIHDACYAVQLYKLNNPQENLGLHAYATFKKMFLG